MAPLCPAARLANDYGEHHRGRTLKPVGRRQRLEPARGLVGSARNAGCPRAHAARKLAESTGEAIVEQRWRRSAGAVRDAVEKFVDGLDRGVARLPAEFCP